MRLIQGAAVLALLTSVSGTAAAQADAGEWTIAPRAGWVTYQRETSLQNTQFLGGDISYNLNRMFALGANLSVARPQTRGEDFLTSLTFGIPTDGDTTYFFAVTQPVTVFDVGINATARFPMARFTPYLTGGIGSYSLYSNPQVARESRRTSAMSGNFGGGVAVQISSNAGIHLDVRDQIFTKYDRERLRASEGRFSDNRFPEEFVIPPAPKETLHNMQFSIGFSFTPRTAGEESR